MSNYIYHGNWAKVSICTPKGKRVEEHYEAWGYDGSQDSQKELCLDEYNYDYTDCKSDRRLRYCHCGWSKVTTYQDLRTHQGKRGCTPKGVKVKEHEQQYYGSGDGGYQDSQEDQYLDEYNSDYTDCKSDRRLRYCHCGWSKVTTYQDLRTHQGKRGCTPKGVKVKEHEQQYYGSGDGGYQDSQEDQYLDEYNSDYTDNNSDRRLRNCHCGWSKVTTYQGLRIHQGKQGCTPKGVKVKEHDQQYHRRGGGGYQDSQEDQYLDEYNSDYIHNNSGRHLRDCHCGWSKVTTYRGLRIHQGKMGCTPKGIRIPEYEQPYWKSQWEMRQRSYQPAVWIEERDQYCSKWNVELPYGQNDWLDDYNFNKTDSNSDRRLRYCHCGWSKVTTYQDLRTHQGKTGCTPKGIRIPESEQPYWKSQWEMMQGSGCDMREI